MTMDVFVRPNMFFSLYILPFVVLASSSVSLGPVKQPVSMQGPLFVHLAVAFLQNPLKSNKYHL